MESIENIQSEIIDSFESQNEIRREKFNIVNKVGLLYAIGIAIMFQFEQIFFMIVKRFFSDFIKSNRNNIILLGTLIVNQILGPILMFSLTKCIKRTKIKKCKYGLKKYLANLCINSGLLILGSLVGYIMQFCFLHIFINSSEIKSNSAVNHSSIKGNIFLNFFIICFTAPIAEELMFRKFLIDRVAIYSKTLAIFTSGILFGIFHINIHQFFGAMFSGWSLAYSYAETGNILIPISYHIIENSFTTIIQMGNLNNNINTNSIKAKIFVLFVLFRLIEALIGIIFLIIYRKKIKVTGEENKFKDIWKFCKSYGMWIFIFEGFILFSIFYMNVLF